MVVIRRTEIITTIVIVVIDTVGEKVPFFSGEESDKGVGQWPHLYPHWGHAEEGERLSQVRLHFGG